MICIDWYLIGMVYMISLLSSEIAAVLSDSRALRMLLYLSDCCSIQCREAQHLTATPSEFLQSPQKMLASK